MPLASTSALSLKNVGKTYAGQVAIADINLEVNPGEVHGLVGENGCGKSTLIKCLSGYHPCDPGSEITVAGQALPHPHSPRQAREAGLAFVHQDLGLIDDLTVLENMALGRGFSVGRGWRINWTQEENECRALLTELGVDVSPNAHVRSLSQADKTLVAITRGLRDAGSVGQVLILDEPTAALPDAEVVRLFEFIRRLQSRGLAIIYVSHRFSEVFEICQRISVLRDSRVIGTFDVGAIDERELVATMIGRPMDELIPRSASRAVDRTLLAVQHLSGQRVRDVSFELREGEILGVAGLLGSGRSELARLLAGAQAATSGTLHLGDATVTLRGSRSAIRQGIVMVPEDRRRQGGVMPLPITTNITLPAVGKFFRHGRLALRRERAEVDQLLTEFDIRPKDAGKPFYQLSGGNQQKVVLAKWMRLNPRVIVFDEPVQGVDVGAKAQIYENIERAASKGTGVVLIDSDFEDLARVCDRVLILRAGQAIGMLAADKLTRERIVELVYLSGKEVA